MDNNREKTSKFPLILSLCLVVGFVIAYLAFPGVEHSVDEAIDVLTSEDEERISGWVAQFGAWGPIAIVVGMVLQMFFFIIPNILLIFISVVSYGPIWGSLLAWFGIFLASSVGYGLGRKLSPVLVKKLVSPKTQHKLREFLRDYGMKAIIVLRASSLSNDGLSLVAGLLNMKYQRFINATMIGITPLITVIALFGHSGRVERGLLFVGIFLLVCLIIYIIIDKRQERKRQVSRSDSA